MEESKTQCSWTKEKDGTQTGGGFRTGLPVDRVGIICCEVEIHDIIEKGL